jgi:hypothetical protein
MKKIGVLLVLVVASLSAAQQTSRPTVYLEPQQGFETHIAAAIAKKSVPVDVVTDKNKAIYILRSAPVEVKSESTGGKIARCLFAYCAGIEDKGNVSVQLIAASSTKMVWAYSVNKQRGAARTSSKNQQSMAEAVAKHSKENFLSGAPAIAEAPAPTPAPAVAEVPVPTPVPAAVAPAPPPAPVASAAEQMFTWSLRRRAGHRSSPKMRVWRTPHDARSNIRRAWAWPKTIPVSPATDCYAVEEALPFPNHRGSKFLPESLDARPFLQRLL